MYHECECQKKDPSKILPGLQNGNMNQPGQGTESLAGPIPLTECPTGEKYSNLLQRCIKKSTGGDVIG
ncbi:unnamed protein product [Orchesella dallaii]|uniref:Uncharacterized protein n=1 Tax=Orchesella dallaii TaxID=48710 RepID=A0ABP1R8M4_9HEXA